MKKYKYIILVSLLTMLSCEKEFLDLVPDNVATIDNAFSNRTAAKAILATCYSYLPTPGDKFSDPSILCGDEIVQSSFFNDLDGVRISKGFQTATEAYFDRWIDGGLYQGIRNCNLLINRIGEVRDMEEYEQKQWIAEAKFLKAYYHFYLARMYGPIVINYENISVEEGTDAIAPERSTIDEVFPYIIKLLDEAIVDLPTRLQNDEFGRITKQAAAAIKARVAVTYASPMFNGNGVYTGFVNSKGELFFPTTKDDSKWDNAALACKEAIDLCHENSHRLHITSDYNQREAQSDITLLKAALRGRVTDPWNFEIIWGSTQNPSVQKESMAKLFTHAEGDPLDSNRGPSLRIAEQFYTVNGVPIEEDVNFDYTNRYKLRTATDDDKYFVEPNATTVNLHFDREPRFYSDLGFDRGTWFGNGREKTDEAWYVHGRFGEYGSVSAQNFYSASGYFSKKLVNIKTTVSSSLNFSQTRYPFPFIRLSDLYLYYAEALNESKAAPDNEVYEYIDKVRERSGLNGVVESWTNYSTDPSKPNTQAGMRKIIQQERLIEMAFEGGRFWDLRRWLLAKDFLNKPIKGWNVLANTDNPEIYYQTVILNSDKFSGFEEKDYLWPIPQKEIINITSLNQNPGW